MRIFIFPLTESYIDLDAEQKAIIFKGKIDNINGAQGFSAQELGFIYSNKPNNRRKIRY